ncbi:hypothetical protein DES49_2193 [Halospina denitrificans]|uniref:Uncharacterized protein n=1 Tax=Halospina denitrificans TaxID=332522 RepID=A0A4R7JN69_9GAMM|nr:hypothetical protein DES49_2193 [Halospina denitrificans]
MGSAGKQLIHDPSLLRNSSNRWIITGNGMAHARDKLAPGQGKVGRHGVLHLELPRAVGKAGVGGGRQLMRRPINVLPGPCDDNYTESEWRDKQVS